MTGTTLFPRLDAHRAASLRKRLLSSRAHETVFDEGVFEEALQDARAFPPTGGVRVRVAELIELRRELGDATTRARQSERGFESAFDLEVGRALGEAGRGARGEFGNPGVWDFITLVLIPDIAVQRIRAHNSDSIRASASKRLTGGDRRHILQKLWKRWHVFGTAIVTAGVLTEDDYVATLERHITLQRRQLARATANAIVSSGYSGSMRREYTRVFMRNLQQVSGLVQIRDDDSAHVASLIDHVHQQTASVLS